MIEIRTLGRTAIAVNGEELSGEAAWPKSLALIVYMACEPGPDRRDQILGTLWPDREEKRARHALNQLLYTLRKTSPALDLESIEDALDFGSDVWLDADEFEQRLEAGDLEAAVDLYGGPFLVDLIVEVPEFDHWADRKRADLARKFRKAALELATRAKEAAEYDRAVSFCRRALEADVLDDEAQHLLIESLYLRGDRVAALRQYEQYRDLLERELDVEPLEHTEELVERVRAEPPPGVEAPDVTGTGSAPEPAEAAAAATEPTGRRPGGEAAPAPGRRGPLWGALALVSVAALLVAAGLWQRGRDAPRPNEGDGGVVATAATHLAVLPFRVEGAGAGAAGVGRGLARVLALNLEGLGPIRTVDYRSVLSRWDTAELSAAPVWMPEELAGFGRDLGASSVLTGSVHRAGERVRLVGDLVAAADARTLARAEVEGPEVELFALADRLTLELVEEVWTAADVPSPAALARSTESLAALKHYLSGRIHSRVAEWEPAVAEYRAAVREDSTFVPAVRSLAETLLWTTPPPRTEAAELFARARRLAGEAGRSERDMRFDRGLDHVAVGNGPAAIREFEALAERHPQDFAIQYQLAEAYFRFGPRAGVSLALVAERLRRLLERDPDLVPALERLWWTAMWRGDEEAARRWASRFTTATGGAGTRLPTVAAGLRYGNGEALEGALTSLAQLPSREAALAVLAVALGPDGDPVRARRAARALLDPARPLIRRAMGARLLAALELATGRPQAAQGHLEMAGRFGMPAGELAGWRALAGVYQLADWRGTRPPPGSESAGNEPEARVRDTWLRGAQDLRRGDPEAARAAIVALEGVGQPQLGVVAAGLARGLRAELALAAGDTASAVEALRTAVARYPDQALLSPWQTLPYYRVRLGELLAASGDHEAALGWFRSLNDRSLGDLLFRARMHRGLAECLTALGQSQAAERHRRALERWTLEAGDRASDPAAD